MRYRGHFQTIASAYVVVEADDREAAIKEAHKEGAPGLCASCAGWGRPGIDLGEWETVDQGFVITAQSIEETVEEVAP